MIFRRSAKDAAAEAAVAADAAGATPATTEPSAGDETVALEPAAAEPTGAEVEGAQPETAEPEAAEPETGAPSAAAAPPAEALQETAISEALQDTVIRQPAVAGDGTGGGGDDQGEPPTSPKRRRRGRKVLIGIGAAVVLLCGGYAAAAWYFSDKVPQDTTVAGVDLSGLTIDEAEAALTDQLADVLVEPIPVEMGEVSTTIDPVAAGLQLDAGATVDSFTGFTLEPQIVLGHLFGLGVREPVVVVDEDALAAAVDAAATDLDVAPVDGVLELVDGAAEITTEPADGLSLDVEAAAAALPGDWLVAERPFVLPSSPVAPTIDDAVIDEALTTITDPLLSAPVTVRLTEDESIDLSPDQLADAATLQPDGARLELVLDGDALAAVIDEEVPSIGESPKDAQIVLEDGEPTIIPAVTGTGLDRAQLATVVSEAAVATGEDRVAVVELAETEADFSTEDAEALGVVEVIGEYSTPYPYDPQRTVNLINGAAHINGTLILPGEEFSLIEALGPITVENGYVSSHVVDGGFVTDAMGGGLSQISTTTFNAAYEGGMEDIHHKPHSRWFDRYPAGRESTMFAPSLDMVWGNNTPYGVLVQAWVDQSNSRVHVRLWGTDYWDVDIVSSEKYAYTAPRTIYNTRPNCAPESAGPSGFSIDITRTVARDGVVNDEYSDSYTWTYSPWNQVVCGEPPSPDDEDDEEDEAQE